MSKSEAKKELILSCGLQTMMANGYNGTSVKDIVDAAGVPKGSFYNYFASKEAFAVTAIDKQALDSYQQASALLSAGGQSPMQRLEAFFTANTTKACEGEFRIGCFMGNMCQEMADNSETIRLKIKQVLRKLSQLIQDVIEQAQQQGEASNQHDAALLAEFLLNAWEGALMRVKASKCREPLDAFLTMLPTVLQADQPGRAA